MIWSELENGRGFSEQGDNKETKTQQREKEMAKRQGDSKEKER